MDAVNFNLSFSECLRNFFKNCLLKPRTYGGSQIENLICKYYNIEKTQNIFYEKMAFLYDCFYNNREEFKKEVKKIKDFTEWQLF